MWNYSATVARPSARADHPAHGGDANAEHIGKMLLRGLLSVVPPQQLGPLFGVQLRTANGDILVRLAGQGVFLPMTADAERDPVRRHVAEIGSLGPVLDVVSDEVPATGVPASLACEPVPLIHSRSPFDVSAERAATTVVVGQPSAPIGVALAGHLGLVARRVPPGRHRSHADSGQPAGRAGGHAASPAVATSPGPVFCTKGHPLVPRLNSVQPHPSGDGAHSARRLNGDLAQRQCAVFVARAHPFAVCVGQMTLPNAGVPGYQLGPARIIAAPTDAIHARPAVVPLCRYRPLTLGAGVAHPRIIARARRERPYERRLDHVGV